MITFPLLLDDAQAQGAPVDVIDLGTPGWRTSTGRIRESRGEYLEVVFDEADSPPPAVGTRIVLNLRKGGGERHSGDVTRNWPGGFEIRKRRTRLPERRVYPRLMGGVPLTYTIIAADDAEAEALGEQWVELGMPAPDDTWRSPDPLMNFSVTGLCFEDAYEGDEPPGMPGDVFLGWMAVGSDARRYRVAGRLVRAAPIDPEQQKSADGVAAPPTHRIAVNFTAMEDEAVEALTAYTLKLQLANL
ncbi:MAG: hypothetical protein ACE366_03055 [Bradymonadia bacterium]